MDDVNNLGGVKTFNRLYKNANSVDNYHIVSNLTNEQQAGKIAYDGTKKESEVKKTTSQEQLNLSERL